MTEHNNTAALVAVKPEPQTVSLTYDAPTNGLSRWFGQYVPSEFLHELSDLEWEALMRNTHRMNLRTSPNRRRLASFMREAIRRRQGTVLTALIQLLSQS